MTRGRGARRHHNDGMGRASDPFYFRKWRAAHPGYRAKDAERKRRWRAAMSPERRALTHGSHGARIIPPIPPLHQGSPIFERAKQIAERLGQHPDRRVAYVDPTYDDLISEISVAILERRDPLKAGRVFLSECRKWTTRHVFFLDGPELAG